MNTTLQQELERLGLDVTRTFDLGEYENLTLMEYETFMRRLNDEVRACS